MIPVIVLAAGKSSRMGRSKALLPIDGRTFLTRILETCLSAGLTDVVVVVGHDADAIRRAAEEFAPAIRVVRNPAYETGQLSSVLAGLDAADRPGVRAVMLTLVDVPLVSASTFRAVRDRYLATGAPVVRPVRGALHGHPVLIDRSLFAELRASDPRLGAKPVVRAHVSPAGDVEVADEGAFLDIDTQEQYARVLDERR